MAKDTFAASGTGTPVNTRDGVVYYVDFTTGSGSGSAVLQVKVNGEWLTAVAAVTATSSAVGATEATGKSLEYRWSVTRNSGTIYTYLE